MKLTLPNGSSPRGAQMGRRNTLPDDPAAPIKLRLEKLRFVDGGYDQWGAYWGGGWDNGFIWCAWDGKTYVLVRAQFREQAKILVRDKLPKARFYR